jgi:tetratricopeptide (TPR) repeat protein
MPGHFQKHTHHALLALTASLGVMCHQAAMATSVSSQRLTPQSVPLSAATESPASKDPTLPALGNASGLLALNAVSRGGWGRACSMATTVLAHKLADVDALGIFALCAAIRSDNTAVTSALERLPEVEPTAYYGALTQGVTLLRSGAPEKAQAAFKTVLQAHPGNPLALYFSAEALHARQLDAQAVTAFKMVLKSWPDYTPALSAVAALTAVKGAPREILLAAASMSERAARIEPTNLKYWAQTADLCERAGQADRASAIRLQWLSHPNLSAK